MLGSGQHHEPAKPPAPIARPPDGQLRVAPQALWVNVEIASKMPLSVYLGGAVALLAATLVVARFALAKRRAMESFAGANPDQYRP